MRTHFLLKLALFLSISQLSFSQNVYKFTGNGSWQDVSNWLDYAMPPYTIANGDSIIIDPDGECVLDLEQSITDGAILIVRPGKKFIILGSLIRNADSTFADPRDGQVYPIKTIGTQMWMTKNLNYEAPGSWCYDDDAANCAVYGRLYDWSTALTVAPPGWHLPSDAEWATLINFFGGEGVAGSALKATTLWDYPNEGATNKSGFSGRPGGFRDSDGPYFNIGSFGYWWSSTESSTNFALSRNLYYQNAYASRIGSYKFVGLSVRCIRD